MNAANTLGLGIIHPDELEVILSLIGQGEENETKIHKQHRLARTLKATLLAKHQNISSSYSSTGHEVYSSLPTYWKAASSADPVYVGISLASLGIAGLINFQGSAEEDEFNIALAVWSEFQQAREEARKITDSDKKRGAIDEAFAVLERHVTQFDHIFSKDTEYNPKNFDAHTYDLIAQEKGIWKDPKAFRQKGLSYIEKTRQALQNGFKDLTLTDAWHATVTFSAHMAVDALTKWSQKSTYTDIRNGFRVAPSYLTDFKFFSSGLRESRRPQSSLKELKTARRLEDHEIIPKLIESGKLKKTKVEEVVKKRRAIRRDIFNGKIVNAGFILESAFVATHLCEGVIHGYEVGIQKVAKALLDEDGVVQIPAQFLNPEINRAVTEFLSHHAHTENAGVALGLNVYSVLMVLGAHAFLGKTSYNIRERIRENQKLLSVAHTEIDDAFTEEFGEPVLESNDEAPQP